LRMERDLSRGPGERAAAEQVDMEMVDGLATVLARVDDCAVALVEPLGLSDLSSGPDQVTEEGAIVFGGSCHGDDMFARRYQHVHGGLWIDVCEGVAQLVLVDSGRGNASINDFAKEATHSGFSLQELHCLGVVGDKMLGL